MAKKIVAPKISVDEAVARLREMHERGDVDAMFAAMLELFTRLAFDNAKLSADADRSFNPALAVSRLASFLLGVKWRESRADAEKRVRLEAISFPR